MRRLRRIELLFPALATDGYEKHSEKSDLYNCVGYAAGDCLHWWDHNLCWPENVDRGSSVADAVTAFLSQRFEICNDDALEPGYEKVAVYSIDGDPNGEWTHAARLRPDGWWESKLGELEDIIHRTTGGVSGTEYGKVAVFIKRRIVDRVRMQVQYRKHPPRGLSLSPTR